MYEEVRVKYLFIDLLYPKYLRLQGVIVGLLVIASVSCFLFLRESEFWLWRNAGWIRSDSQRRHRPSRDPGVERQVSSEMAFHHGSS